MFFSDGDHIDRAHMDGSHRTTIVTAIYKATGLTVDYVTKFLVWCDSQLDQIVAIDYTGSNRCVALETSRLACWTLHVLSRGSSILVVLAFKCAGQHVHTVQ